MIEVDEQKASTGRLETVQQPIVIKTQEGPEGEDDDAITRDYYSTAHKINEIITDQPSILVGGVIISF